MKKQFLLKILLFCFFTVNFLVRWQIVFSESLLLTLVVGLALCALFFCITVFPRYLRYPLWGFAFTFPLFGAISALFTSVYVFEFLLSVQSVALLLVAVRYNFPIIKYNVLSLLLFLYFCYSAFSILLFPLDDYKVLFDPELFFDGWINLLYASNCTSLYSIAGVNRLGIFLFSTLLIACQDNARILFKGIFVSMFFAAVLSAIIGVLNVAGVPYLGFSTGIHEGRLQSFFSHTNCFSMYMVVTSPFVFYGFLKENLRLTLKMGLYAAIVVSVVALLFSFSRAGWVLYPLMLLFGGFCVHWQKKRCRKREDIRCSTSGKGLVLFLVVLIACVGAISSFFDTGTLWNKAVSVSESTQMASIDKIKKRLSEILQPTVRVRIAHDTLSVIHEAPVFGGGFESYGWHTNILSRIPRSDFSRNRKEHQLWGAPHNLYLTHFVNGGIVGLILWLTIIAIVGSLLVSDVLINKSSDALPVILGILVFHLYGMVESMQFAPIIWFSVMLYIAYGITINESVLPANVLIFFKRWSVVCGIFVLLGGIVYAANYQSWQLAEKYNLPRYYQQDNLEQVQYSGFYTPVQSPIGITRWMGKRASIEIVRSGVMEFNIVCQHPDIQNKPIIVTMEAGGRVIDQIVFVARGIQKRQFFFPESSVGEKININVSRTWNPKKYGAKWGRIQGVAVSAPNYTSEVTADGVGFSVWEKMQGQLPEWAQSDQQYRWTGKSATIRVDDVMRRQGVELYIRSRHPDVGSKPVEVQLFVDEKLVDTVILSSANWQRLFIDQERLSGKKTLTFYVSRTWNPQLAGISTDNRSLGIAVAIP
jgi:O-antigen ligase